MIKAELHSGVTEEVLKELVFIVQWKKDTSLKLKKKKNQKCSDNKKITAHIYTLLTTSLFKTESVFIHLFTD